MDYATFLADVTKRELSMLMNSALKVSAQTNDPNEIALCVADQNSLLDKGLVTEIRHRREEQGGVVYDVFDVEAKQTTVAMLIAMLFERVDISRTPLEPAPESTL
jgi:hypothetical protein